MRTQLGIERVQHLGNGQVLGAGDRQAEMIPELTQYLLPVGPAARDLVEQVLEVGREGILDVAFEEILQERGHQPATVLRREALLVERHILAVLQHLDDRGIGRRPADAQLFQLLHQARFGVARRRLGEMLLRPHVLAVEGFALDHRRQATVLIIVGVVVAAFLIKLQEAVEAHDRAGCAERDPARRAIDVGRDLVHHRRFHLAGDGTLPDQLVEPELIGIEHLRHLGRMAEHIGRADRLMRLLGVLGDSLIKAGCRAAHIADRSRGRSTGGPPLPRRPTAPRRRFAYR